LDLLIDAVEAPWGIRHERALRAVFDPEDKDPYIVSADVIEKVRELGMDPFDQPEPLPVIEPDDVALICWMAVERGQVAEKSYVEAMSH
jgi:hypothetical protein